MAGEAAAGEAAAGQTVGNPRISGSMAADADTPSRCQLMQGSVQSQLLWTTGLMPADARLGFDASCTRVTAECSQS